MSSDNVTVVSLSAYEQDCLLLRSNVLARKSPWFKAIFKPVWDDQQGIKILELEFDVEEPLGFLIGKVDTLTSPFRNDEHVTDLKTDQENSQT